MTITLPEGVRLDTINGLDAVIVETDTCSGEVLLQGAQVTRWRPAGQPPVLFVAEQSVYTVGKSVRGGVPLCGPWFGPGRSGNRTPAHGFYRRATWRLVEAGAETGVVELRFELTADDLTGLEIAVGWPSDAVLELRVRFGAELEVALTTRTGADGLDLEEALHSYLQIGDIRHVSITGLAETEYVDKVAGGRLTQQHGDVSFTGETDRIYDSTGTVVVHDPVLDRRITVAKSGSASTVVWNPGVEKGSELADLGDEWSQMVCVETANCGPGAIFIAPDSEHTLTTRVSVQ